MTTLTVLAVPDCPHLPALEERVAQVLSGAPGTVVRRLTVTTVTVTTVTVLTVEEAAQWGMHGSPTLLVDGRDPFAEPGAQASVSCRVGTAALPSVEAIRAAVASERPGG
jgi:hypothetical protein